jgi:hypothetical protein
VNSSSAPSITRTWPIDAVRSTMAWAKGARSALAISTRASDDASMSALCAASRRGLSVWHTAPIPMIAYQDSRWACVFQAKVATRSPCDMPSSASAAETRRARSSRPA